MLNPETVVMKRCSGVRPRESLSGLISSNNKGDNPLMFTGAGHTAIELDLVFDISIGGSSIVTEDVRELTKPIWNLTENHQRADRLYRPALCRFLWGKSWNIPGVISSVAEKLESFSAEGVPRRSWMRLEMIRMIEQPRSELDDNDLWSGGAGQTGQSFLGDFNAPEIEIPSIDSQFNDTNSIADTLENSFERIDLKADRLKGDSSSWREISTEFNIDNPLEWVKSQLEGQIDSLDDSEDVTE